MDSTSTAEFRAKMKEWFDSAENGPVKVKRPNGKAVVILGQEKYEAMALELQEFRQLAKGLLAIGGNSKQYSEDELEDVAKRSADRLKEKQKRKATG